MAFKAKGSMGTDSTASTGDSSEPIRIDWAEHPDPRMTAISVAATKSYVTKIFNNSTYEWAQTKLPSASESAVVSGTPDNVDTEDGFFAWLHRSGKCALDPSSGNTFAEYMASLTKLAQTLAIEQRDVATRVYSTHTQLQDRHFGKGEGLGAVAFFDALDNAIKDGKDGTSAPA
jgi:hypothetical protein